MSFLESNLIEFTDKIQRLERSGTFIGFCLGVGIFMYWMKHKQLVMNSTHPLNDPRLQMEALRHVRVAERRAREGLKGQGMINWVLKNLHLPLLGIGVLLGFFVMVIKLVSERRSSYNREMQELLVRIVQLKSFFDRVMKEIRDETDKLNGKYEKCLYHHPSDHLDQRFSAIHTQLIEKLITLHQVVVGKCSQYKLKCKNRIDYIERLGMFLESSSSSIRLQISENLKDKDRLIAQRQKLMSLQNQEPILIDLSGSTDSSLKFQLEGSSENVDIKESSPLDISFEPKKLNLPTRDKSRDSKVSNSLMKSKGHSRSSSVLRSIELHWDNFSTVDASTPNEAGSRSSFVPEFDTQACKTTALVDESNLLPSSINKNGNYPNAGAWWKLPDPSNSVQKLNEESDSEVYSPTPCSRSKSSTLESKLASDSASLFDSRITQIERELERLSDLVTENKGELLETIQKSVTPMIQERVGTSEKYLLDVVEETKAKVSEYRKWSEQIETALVAVLTVLACKNEIKSQTISQLAANLEAKVEDLQNEDFSSALEYVQEIVETVKVGRNLTLADCISLYIELKLNEEHNLASLVEFSNSHVTELMSTVFEAISSELEEFIGLERKHSRRLVGSRLDMLIAVKEQITKFQQAIIDEVCEANERLILSYERLRNLFLAKSLSQPGTIQSPTKISQIMSKLNTFLTPSPHR